MPKLDRLQARTLHGAPFGHRCARNNHVSRYAAADKGSEDEEDEEDEDEQDDFKPGEEDEPAMMNGPVSPAVVS